MWARRGNCPVSLSLGCKAWDQISCLVDFLTRLPCPPKPQPASPPSPLTAERGGLFPSSRGKDKLPRGRVTGRALRAESWGLWVGADTQLAECDHAGWDQLSMLHQLPEF